MKNEMTQNNWGSEFAWWTRGLTILLAAEFSLLGLVCLNVYDTLRMPDTPERADQFIDIVFSTAHFGMNTLALSELYARCWDKWRAKSCNISDVTWTPSWCIVSLVGVLVDTLGYLRSSVAHSKSLTRTICVFEISLSTASFFWCLGATDYIRRACRPSADREKT